MSRCILGSRSRRAAAFVLFWLSAVVGRTDSAAAEGVVVGDQVAAVVSDGMDSGDCNEGCYSDCYGACESCSSCGDSCCATCNNSGCCAGWFGAEYLVWRLEGNKIPPLVTAGPANVPLADVAQLDQPTTVILSGDEDVNDDWRSGYRVYGGFWLDCCRTWGIGVDYFDVGDDDYNFVSPQDSFVVGRPFFNTELGEDDVELVSVPDELDGTAQVQSSDEFQGAGLTLNHSLWRCCDPCCGNSAGVSLLGGYRYYNYDSDLSVTERLTVLPNTTTALVPGTTFFVQDRFRTENEFDGGEIGLQAFRKRCWWWVDGMGKLAMGSQRRTVRVAGETFVAVPDDGTALNEGGLLTSELTNIGRYSDSDFVLIPEFRLGIGACVTKCISVRAGYNVILWGDVARAASHLPPGLEVDPRNLPPVQNGGGEEPEFPGIRGSQLVAHGLDASVQIQW